MKTLAGLLLILFGAQIVGAQVISQFKVTAADNGKRIEQVLAAYEKEFNVNFYSEYQDRVEKVIRDIVEETTMSRYLRQHEIDLDIYVYDTKHFLLLSGLTEVNLRKGKVQLLPVKRNMQGIKGTVDELAEGTPMIGANLYLPIEKDGAVTDFDGRYLLTPKNDLALVEVTYAGYEMQTLLLMQTESTNVEAIDLELALSTDFINTVTITAERNDANITDQRTGIESLKIESIKLLPTFLGEVDPIKGITTLPGVNSAGDIASGFNVRGGENSQNLILQDGAIIYNPTHMFGFFSAFNPDFMSSVTLMKGGGPATFGGRVASVLDINTRNGSLNNYKVTGSLGMVSSRLGVEGPIVKNKSSFLLGGRYSYSDWFLRSFEDVALKKSKANFYDMSAKLFHQVNPKNFISVSGYASYDDFNLGRDTTYAWGTKNLSLKWSHIVNDKAQYLVTLANSNYESEIISDDQIFGFTTTNGIKAYSADIRYEREQSPTTHIETGASVTYSQISPGERVKYSDASVAAPIDLSEQNALEAAVFLESNVDLNERWAMSVGLRYAHFLRLGAGEVPILDYDNISGRTASLKEMRSYDSGEVIESYGGVEPRVSIRYLLNETSSIKGGFHRGQQFIHQVSPTTTPSPLDFWISSSPNIKPQRSSQYSIGYFKNMKDNEFETSIEGFYKSTASTIDYIEGVDLNLNPILEAGLTQGNGQAYGVELLLKRNRGDINGWIAYTYSRSYRKFNDPLPTKTVNGGKRYPSVFDQPHQVSIILNKKLSKEITLSTNFTYNSGRPITVPISKFSYGPILSVNNYSTRNEYRIPDYHRLDVSITFRDRNAENRKYTSEWVLSVYNIYARKNAFAIYFDNRGQAFKTSILGTIFPSLSYNFKIK